MTKIMGLSKLKWNNASGVFHDDIPGSLQEGMIIFIQGIIPIHAEREAVDLMMANGDIALHINPRFNESCLLFNTRTSDRWGNAIKLESTILEKDKLYEVVIAVMRSHFKIAINGKHTQEYEHRIGYCNVSRIQISSNLGVYFVRYDLKGCLKFKENLKKSIPLPLCEKIFGGLSVGSVILTSGEMLDSVRLTFNIQNGKDARTSDIALHFTTVNQQIITNHRLHGQWGTEERKNNPFKPYSSFQIMIAFDWKAFKVAVNNMNFTSFEHRIMELDCYHYLIVDGNITLHPIQYFNSLLGFNSVLGCNPSL